jgi:signal transduction histidine kinase
MRSPLKGLGVGLSLSRWHMRHFGGDLTLENRGGNNPQHENKTIRVRGDSPGGRRSKWYTLDKGMTATIRIPKNDNIPVVIS